MTQLVYRDSTLKLLSLERRQVKSEIPSIEGEATEELGIYRHVLEMELAGMYPDMLRYMQAQEQLNWNCSGMKLKSSARSTPPLRLDW